jgi:hypothetical protein
VNRAVAILLAALVVQCGLVALAYWPADTPAETAAGNQFVSFNPAEIDRVTVGDGYGNEVVLEKSGGRWTLPALDNMPADAGRVEAVLGELGGGEPQWPIARSASAHERFEVAEQRYQRRLVLATGADPVATVYLGTSPGFRKVHARGAGQDAVFSIELNNFDIPAAPGGWLDPRLLQVRVPVRIHADLYSLRYEDGRWMTGGGLEPDETELQILLTALKTLTIGGVAGAEQSQRLAQLEADVIMEVESLAGTVILELLSVEGRYFIRSSEYPMFFEIDEDNFRRLADVDPGLVSAEQLP